MRLVMLREFRVRVLPCHYDLLLHLCISTERCPLSFRPGGSEWRNLWGAPPNRRTGGAILCAVPMVAVRQGPISACGAPREARQGHQAGADVRQFGGGGCRGRSGCNHAIRNMGFGYVRISCVQGYGVVEVFSCTLLAESVQDDAFSGDVCMKIVYERLFRVHIRCVPEGGDRFLDSACGVARNDRGKCLRPKPGMTGECLRPRAGMTGVVLRPKPE